MSRVAIHRLLNDQSGATAAIFGLSLFALIAIGGVGFDYARLAGMDSELQNAADQAALAGASQLDGKNGACLRASAAASDPEFLKHFTLLANDGNGAAVTIAPEPDCDAVGKIRFWQNKEKTQAATDDGNANFIEIFIGFRTANYSFTPLVAAFGGDASAAALAGLGSAICKVPPVMFCNPAEPINNTNTNLGFDANALAGSGMKLITGNATAPGNFGFLESGFGSGASNLAAALGYNSVPGDCLPITGVTTKPGLNAVVMDALNTRFDLDTNGANTCPAGGTCSPSRNVRKDLVKGNNCGTSGQQGWQESPSPYRPTTAANLTSGYPDIMGHPRDLCHAISNDLSASVAAGCTLAEGRIGNGAWDRDAYFWVNYGWNSATWPSQTGLGANVSRYDVYLWELNNTGLADMQQAMSGNKDGYSYPVCRGTGVTPDETTVDRRRISAAVINCEALNLNGSEGSVPVLKWVDLFLVEPSYRRRRGGTVVTEATDVYVELIGETGSGTAGQTAGQVVQRNVPYLLE